MKCCALVVAVVACSLAAGCKPNKPAVDPRAGAPAQAEASYRPPTDCDLRAQSYPEPDCFANLGNLPADEGLKTLVLAEIKRGMYERSAHTDSSGHCWWDTTVEVDYRGQHQRQTVSCPVPDSVKIQ